MVNCIEAEKLSEWGGESWLERSQNLSKSWVFPGKNNHFRGKVFQFSRKRQATSGHQTCAATSQSTCQRSVLGWVVVPLNGLAFPWRNNSRWDLGLESPVGLAPSSHTSFSQKPVFEVNLRPFNFKLRYWFEKVQKSSSMFWYEMRLIRNYEIVRCKGHPKLYNNVEN